MFGFIYPGERSDEGSHRDPSLRSGEMQPNILKFVVAFNST
jgi:hypothetical protein